MDKKLQLVELIEEQRTKLSPAGRELWLSAEKLIETSRPSDNTEDLERAQLETLQQSRDLPVTDQLIWETLTTLFLGLRASDLAEDRWGAEIADKFRTGFIIRVAHERATAEGRTVLPEPDMSLDEALDLLAED